jgi:hypothetical protein
MRDDMRWARERDENAWGGRSTDDNLFRRSEPDDSWARGRDDAWRAERDGWSRDRDDIYARRRHETATVRRSRADTPYDRYDDDDRDFAYDRERSRAYSARSSGYGDRGYGYSDRGYRESDRGYHERGPDARRWDADRDDRRGWTRDDAPTYRERAWRYERARRDGTPIRDRYEPQARDRLSPRSDRDDER